MLNAAMVTGTGRRAGLLLHPAAGKTGTTQEFRDAWFIGYTAHLTGGVWIGNDQGRTMNNVRGGSLPALIWRDIMATAHQGRPVMALPGTAAPTQRPRDLPVAVNPAVSGPISPRADMPLMPRDGIDRDFVARALRSEPDRTLPTPVAEPPRNLVFPRFAPEHMMSLGRTVQ